jgi:Tfp pilus assembly protein PilW
VNRLRRPRGDDSGLTLIEMLIVMGMASVLMITMGMLFVSGLRQNRTVIGKTTSTADARIGMEAMTRELRVAVVPPGQAAALATATPTSLSFYSSIGASTQTTDPNASLVSLTADTTHHCLWRAMTPATVVGTTWSWPVANIVQGCIARGDINPSGTALFTYYVLASDGTVSTTPLAAGSISANLANIVAVGINLAINDPNNPTVAPTTLQDQVTLINIANALQAG